MFKFILSLVCILSSFALITADGPDVIDFGATWCAPCRRMEPILKNLEKDFQVLRVDIDNDPAFTKQHRVTAVPTILIMRNGAVFERFVGETSEATLRGSIARARKVTPPKVNPLPKARISEMTSYPDGTIEYNLSENKVAVQIITERTQTRKFTTRPPIGHTHTCSNGHTWDHKANPTHTCKFCGRQQFVQDTPARPVTILVEQQGASSMRQEEVPVIPAIRRAMSQSGCPNCAR